MTRMIKWRPVWDWSMTPTLRLSAPSQTTASRSYVPPMDIEEEEDRYVVTLSVPGFSQDNLQIELDDDVLQIRGSLASDSARAEEAAERKYRLRERHMNQFSRSLRLPAGIDASRISAKYETGILSVTIPKPEEVLPKQIRIAVS